jgi:error-prone DNA polymerase
MGYVELHAHSAYSFLDGASTPEELAAAAAVHGYHALALTDHDGIWGAMELAHACRGLGIRAITGAEVTIAGGQEKPAHLTLLVEDRAGYRNLCRLLTLAHAGTREWCASFEQQRRSSRGRRGAGGSMESSGSPSGPLPRARTRAPDAPQITLDQLERHAQGLVCLSGCAREGPLATRVERGDLNGAESLGRRLLAAFGPDRFRVELQRPFWRRDRARNCALAELAARLGVPSVATGDVHSHHPDRARLQDAFVSVRLHATLDQTEPQRRGNSSSVMTPPAEMAARFRDHPDAVAETERLAERLEFDLTRDLGYRYPGADDPDADRKLAALCRARLGERYPGRAERSEAGARLDEELGVIRALGLSGFFLLHHDLLELAREVAREVRGLDSVRSLLPPGRGRGSSVSSIVCYLTGLSHIDPVRNRLFLGRFLNAEITALPDIDLDFPRDIREKLIPRVHDRYGPERAALVAAFATYRWRGAIRDLGKALGLPAGEIERVARAADIYGDAESFARGVAEAIGSRRAESVRWRALVELGPEAYGLPRHISQHPGGMVIATEPLIDLCPVQPAAMEGRSFVQWDKDSCADAGFLKIDLLGLGMLSAVERCVEEIGRVRGERIDLSRIPLDDRAVYRTIQQADTTGVFQIESRAQMQMLRRTRPESLDDLTVQVALVRPGPIQGGAVHPYIERRTRLREDPDFEVPYEHPCLEPVLRETYGAIVFQDQVLEVAMALAGFGPGEAEGLRRAMSRKRSEAAMRIYGERFIEGAVGRGVERAVAERVFSQIQGFSGFGFPKAHAAAFGLLAYQSTWLRVHYGPEFLCSLLNEQPMGFYPPDALVHDAQRRELVVLPPHINRSAVECRVETLEARGSCRGRGAPTQIRSSISEPPDPVSRASSVGRDPLAVRIGLGYVLGVREEEVKALVAERDRNGAFKDAGDLAACSGAGRDTLERLAWAGTCDELVGDFHATRDLNGHGHTRRREALWQLGVVTTGRAVPGGVQLALPLEVPEPPLLRELTAWERLVADYGSTRVSLTEHPMALLRDDLPERAVSSRELEVLPNGRSVEVAGLVVARQRPATAKGVTFMLLEDEWGTINLIVAPPVFERHRLIVRTEPFVLAAGRLERREGTINVVVQRLRVLDRPGLPLADVKRIEPPVERETGRDLAVAGSTVTSADSEHASRPSVAGRGSSAKDAADLRAVMPVAHSFGRRGR